MKRTYLRTMNLAGLALAMLAQPSLAAPKAGAFSATLAVALPAPRREIINGVMWRCEGNQCAAPADGARAQSACAAVVRKFGTVANFTAPQGALAEAELARCNAAR